MRVISGSARGRKLVAPEGSTTRPTSDRVREATFNAIGSLGAVQEAAVLDLFAGSGAMGIEALSRGAARATFVDHDLAARRAIEANLTSCGLTHAVEVVAATAEQFLAGAGRQRRAAWRSRPRRHARHVVARCLPPGPIALAAQLNRRDVCRA